MKSFWLLFFAFVLNSGIEITDIFVPRVCLVGDDITLECRFTQNNDVRVYSIKWWRDNDQFYQYIPRNDPPKMPFNVSGIRVDPNLSSDVAVYISDVTVESSGTYTCEVMADESFETVRTSKSMTVVDPPDGKNPGEIGPVIEMSGVSPINSVIEYGTGKKIEALCIAKMAYPKPTLFWTINGDSVPGDFLTRMHPVAESSHGFTAQLWLSFTATDSLFSKHGKLELTCVCSLDLLYHSNTTVVVDNPMFRRSHNSGFFSAGFSSTLSASLTCFCLFMLNLT